MHVGWTGRETDPETGLSFHRARYYSPELRRWTQEDPIGYGGGGNLYAYVGGAVLEGRDPSGLIEDLRGGGGLGLAESFRPFTLDPTASSMLDQIPLPDGGAAARKAERENRAAQASATQESGGEPPLQDGDINPAMRAGEALRGGVVRGIIAAFKEDIDAASEEFGVDGDLMRSIIYEEQTHLKPGEAFAEEYLGKGKTVGLGQITVGLYGYSREQLLDSRTNIRVMAQHLAVLGARGLIRNDAPISSLATRYNCGSCSSISAYGRRVAHYYSTVF